MANSVDERVVKLTLDTKQFEASINQVLASLDRLNKGLKLEGATKGFSDVSAASKNVDLGGMEKGLAGITERLRTMNVVGVAALVGLANQAVMTGKTLISSLTTKPIMEGFHEYETNLNSIQTILANTGLEGKAGLKKVTDALDELNHYSDQTIYNFSEMAKNIGTFTAAGVKLEVATAAIKGIANLAAVSGSNSQQASTAMYQLSQAISAGRATLEDWNSVVNAGMGGKVFQDSLIETARVHKVNVDQMIKDEGSFRLTLQKGWLTGEILTETLSKFTGDLTAGQLKTMGYNEQQIAGILKMGKVAQDAATKVKTMSQLINTLQEGVTSGWAKTWQLIFGDFDEARELFTGVNDVLGKIIGNSADTRNKMIEDWKALGGRTLLIKGIGDAFNSVMSVLKAVGQAFREIFPASTGKDLFALTQSIVGFIEMLKPSEKTLEQIKRIFLGVFAAVDIGIEIFTSLAGVVFQFFASLFRGSGTMMEFLAQIGDFIVGLRNANEKGQIISRVFEKISDGVAKLVSAIRAGGSAVKEFISDLFGGGIHISGGGLAKKITDIIDVINPLDSFGTNLGRIWDKLMESISKVWNFFAPVASKISAFFKDVGQGLADMFKGLDYDGVLKTIQTGILAGLGGALMKLLMGGMPGGGFMDGINDAIEGLTDTLGALQNTLRAATLLQIAIAIGILAASLAVLASIDTKKLVAATWAITALFTNLIGALLLLEKAVGISNIVGLPALAFGLTLIAVAVGILTISVKALSELDWEGLAKGLVGVGALLGMLVATARFIDTTAMGLSSTAAGLILLGVAIGVLVLSVRELAKLDWNELAKGLTGVAALLASLSLYQKFTVANAGGIAQGAGILLLAAGIKVLASALKDFSQFSWMEIGKGLTVLAGALVAIGAALYLIPPTAAFSAAGVLIVAASLGLIADAIGQMSKLRWREISKGVSTLGSALLLISAALMAIPPTAALSAVGVFIVAASLEMIADVLEQMGKMRWTEIAKSMVALGGSLGIIAIGVNLMTTALPGAAALLVVAASLRVMLPVLLAFSEMSWGEIVKGLAMLAGVFVVLGAAGVILGPLGPVLLVLATAVAIFGAGALLAGAGVFLFAAGLTALAAAGAAGALAIVAIVSGLIGLIPLVMEQIGLGLVAFAKVISTAGPAITKALVTVLNALLDAIVEITPKIVDSLLKMLKMLVDKMNEYVPNLVRQGMKLITAILEGVRDNIQQMVTTAMQVVQKFMDGINDGLPGLIQSGVNMIIKFINTIADAIEQHSEELGRAGGRLGAAIIRGMAKGISAGIGEITSAAKDVASSALDSAKRALGIKSPSREFAKIGKWSDEGLAMGLRDNSDMVVKASSDVAADSMIAMKKTFSGMSEMVMTEVDMNPVISPELDLTNVQQAAGVLNGMLAPRPLTVDAGYSAAAASLGGFQSNQATATVNENTPANIVEFNQYNNSPKALSEAEIYRQTRNQLSSLKGALAG